MKKVKRKQQNFPSTTTEDGVKRHEVGRGGGKYPEHVRQDEKQSGIRSDGEKTKIPVKRLQSQSKCDIIPDFRRFSQNLVL